MSDDEMEQDEKEALSAFDRFLSGVVSDCINGNEVMDRVEAEDERHARMSGPEAVDG